MPQTNLFENIPAHLPEELVEVLAEGEGRVRIERIVSRGQASAEGFWYEQETVEFVVLLKGAARLRFDDEAEARVLAPGDYAQIAKGRRHRVEETSAEGDTVWLAVHWG